MNIYVGNLPYRISDDELAGLFTQFGDVDSAKVIMDRDTGKSKGFAFVEMPDDKAAEDAINALDGSSVQGRNIKVNQARPRRDNRPARTG